MRILAALLLLFSCMANAEIYKWTDENGQVHFGDKPKANAETVEIREQKTGRLVTETQQKTYTKKVAEKPAAVTSNESEDCKQAKQMVKTLREELKQLKFMGIEPLKEIQVEQQIHMWTAQAQVMCGL